MQHVPGILFCLLPARYVAAVAPWLLKPESCFRYVVAVTSDLDKVSGMLDKLLPLMCPRDSVVLLHIVDESVEDVIAGETEDVEEV